MSIQLIRSGETLDDVLERHGFEGGIAAMDALLLKHTGKRGRTQKGGHPPAYSSYNDLELRTRTVETYGPAYERAMRQQGVAAGAQEGWGASAMVAVAAVLAGCYYIYSVANAPALIMGGGKHEAAVDPALHSFLRHLEERVDPCFFAVLSALTTPTHFKDGRMALDSFAELCVHAGIALGDIQLKMTQPLQTAMSKRKSSSTRRRGTTSVRAHRRG
jgi:hypothetical protein